MLTLFEFTYLAMYLCGLLGILIAIQKLEETRILLFRAIQLEDKGEAFAETEHEEPDSEEETQEHEKETEEQASAEELSEESETKETYTMEENPMLRHRKLVEEVD